MRDVNLQQGERSCPPKTRAAAWLLVLAIAVAPAFAQEEGGAELDTPEEAAAKAVAAFTAKDASALKELAGKYDPDPWRVADELCARGEHDAAAAFARAAPREDTASLPAYVELLRRKPADAADQGSARLRRRQQVHR